MFDFWWLWGLAPALLFLVVVQCYAQVDWQNPWLNWIDGFNRLYCRTFHRLRGKAIELPDEGAAILVANHISGLDPLLLLAASPRRLRFLVAREEYQRFGLTWLFRMAGCIPVDRDNRPEQAFKVALQVLAAGEVIALFPQGRIQHPRETMIRLKSGAVRLAYLSGAPIIPVHIQGVRGAGSVFIPLLVPSQDSIHSYPSMLASKAHSKLVLQRMADCISGATPNHE